jgi:DNA (cytosine-5)-methyltransferase 1
MNGLDLFSGIGGIGLALEPWVRTVAYCERDQYAQSVLLSRMQSGDIDRAPIWDDVTTLRGEMLPPIGIIFGGFPCQDLSVAGRGKGLAGERSGLFFEIIRLVKEIKPAFVFLENVPAIRTRGLSEVVNAFTEIGYDCRWTCLSAGDVGAPHKRERWFLLASSNSERKRLVQGTGQALRSEEQEAIGQNSSNVCEESTIVAHANSLRKLSEQREYDRASNSCQDVADSMCERLEGQREEPSGTGKELHYSSDDSWWAVEPGMGRVAHGVSSRVHRIKCLGNGVVPLQVRQAFKKLAGIN